MKSFFTLMFLLFTFKSFAINDCDYNFQIANAVMEVLENSQVIQQNISLARGQNSPTAKCSNYRIYFSKGLSNNYQRKAYSLFGNTINYNLHKTINQSGTLKDYSDAVTSNEFLDGQANERYTTYTNRLFISVPGLANNIIRSGTYYDIVQVSLYALKDSNSVYTFEVTDTFTAVFYIAKNIQISLLDEGDIFDSSSTSKVLDFGILSQNQEKGADLRVLTNGSYQIKISSLNNGQLKLPSGDTIAYSLRVNNSTVSLSSSAASPVTIGSGDATSNAGDLYNLKVKITENTTNKSAGMYQDVITITAIAN
jgi:hypothetical protein